MFPSAVLTHLKAGVRAARAPEPVLMTVCRHPALVTAAKQGRPSLTTSEVASRLRLAKPSTARRQKLPTRRSFSRTGLPSGVVSTAARKGVLPGEPRPRLPPEIGIVELNAAREQPLGVALQHHLPELVLDGPGGALGHAEAAAQLDAGDPLLRLGHMVEGAEPGPQRHLGGGEDGAGGQRGLPSASTTLEQLARPDRAMASLAADRALEALRPAPVEQRLAARRFRAVLLLELRFAEPFLELH